MIIINKQFDTVISLGYLRVMCFPGKRLPMKRTHPENLLEEMLVQNVFSWAAAAHERKPPRKSLQRNARRVEFQAEKRRGFLPSLPTGVFRDHNQPNHLKDGILSGMQTKAVAADLYPNHTLSAEKNQHFKLNDRMTTANPLYLHRTLPPGLRIWQLIHTQNKAQDHSINSYNSMWF